MNTEDIISKLAEHEQKLKSHARRIESLEHNNEVLTDLAVSVKEMAVKQDFVADSVERLSGKMAAIESKPAKRWDAVVDKILLIFVAAVATYILARIGL